MRPQVVTVSSQAISAPLPVNRRERNFKLGITLKVDGTLTASVQFTRDAPTDFASAAAYNSGAVWLDVTNMAGLAATGGGNVEFPVQAVRLNVTAFTSGSATLTVLQAT